MHLFNNFQNMLKIRKHYIIKNEFPRTKTDIYQTNGAL